jgi:hypothetical protein
MNFFDPETGKFFDITNPGSPELNYCFPYPPDYDVNGKMVFMLDPDQSSPGKSNPRDYFTPENIQSLLESVKNQDDFNEGYTFGLNDGRFSGNRLHMSEARYVTWSYILGYEYGFLCGFYDSHLNEK